MSSSRPPPIDLSRRPGESVMDHLARISAERYSLPGTGTREAHVCEVPPGELPEEPDGMVQLRAESFAKLRPRKKGK